MEENKIIWYIVLGAIYFLSKVFGKKKKTAEEETPIDENLEPIPEQTPQKKKPTSFDDILKELSQEADSRKVEQKQELKAKPTTPLHEAPKPTVSETTPLPTYQAEDPVLDKYQDTPSQSKAYTKRKALVFERNKNFAIQTEENEVANGIHDLLADSDGAKQAMILSEILNRKY